MNFGLINRKFFSHPNIIKFNNFRESIFCVRWSPNGDMLASASADKTAKVVDFKTGKVIFSGTTPDSSKL